MGLFLKKSHFLRFESGLSLPNWIGALTLSLLLKLPPRKFGTLIWSMKFLSPYFVLYLYKSAIWPCMKYCCHVWTGSPSYYLELLDRLQKLICRTVSLPVAASLEPLAHRGNVAIFIEEGLLVILIDCMTFLSPFLDVTRMSMSVASFLAQLNSGILWL